jgi:predicted porin
MSRSRRSATARAHRKRTSKDQQEGSFMHQRTLVALAVVAACASSASLAQSSLTLSGLVDAGPAIVKTSGDGFAAADRGSSTQLDRNALTTSWFGFSGTEALGGSLRASFALHAFFRPDTGEIGRFGTTDGMWKRNAWLALEGDFGRFAAGRQGTLYASSIYQTNPFGDSFGYAPMIMHAYATTLDPNPTAPGGLGINDARRSYILNDSGWSNAMSYATPNMAGLVGQLMYSSASGSNDQEDPGNKSRGRSISAQLAYRAGPFVGVGVFQDVNVNGKLPPATATREQKAWLVGAAYNLTVVRLFAQYQDITTDIGTATTSATDSDSTWQLGATVPVGKTTLMASYASTKTDDSTNVRPDESRKTWAVGARYDFSRRTDGYLVYLNDSLDAFTATSVAADKKRTSLGLGVRHRF